MKLTKQQIKWFESEQKEYGTEVALANYVWQIASDLLKDIGVKNIKTTWWNQKKGIND